MNPLLVSSGEPAGVGPDLCLSLAGLSYPLVVLADKELLLTRAKQLGMTIIIDDYQPNVSPVIAPNRLTVLSIPCSVKSIAGKLNRENANYVMRLLETAVERCVAKEFSAIVTAPVHKEIINASGIAFTGHTEFFADYCHAQSVMMLACEVMRVALVTTHLPLKDVPAAITSKNLTDVLLILHAALKQDFKISQPCIKVAGLNPHAGEGGYLGREEIEVITPVIKQLQEEGMNIQGPFPADTLFTSHQADAFVAMYHDQGLPVIKYADFSHAVNITLGLPIIRTSVDHGTALELAGTGKANPASLHAAVKVAANMALNRG